MPNHYHFLLRQDGEISISKFMNGIFNRYAQGFNRQHERSGTLFEGRFKDKLVDKDSYIIQLCRYIHLNPVLAQLVAKPQDWEFSDYHEWIQQRKNWQFDSDIIREYFEHPSEYATFVTDYAEKKEKDKQFMKYLLD